MLKYNGSILKLPSKAIVDYIAPPTLTCTFTGDSTIPMTYSVNGDTFTECGSGTTTGAAELAQIPSGWK